MSLFNRINGLLGRPVIFAKPEDNDKHYPDDAIVFRSYVPENATYSEGNIVLMVYVDDTLTLTLYENDDVYVRVNTDISDYYDEDVVELDKVVFMPVLHSLIGIHSDHIIRIDRVLAITKDIGKMS